MIDERGRPFQPGPDDRRKHGVRLVEKDVTEIRESIAAGYKDAELADIYGVTRVTINNIRMERSWAWLEQPNGAPYMSPPVQPKPKRRGPRVGLKGSKNPASRLTEDQVRAIRALCAAGWDDGAVASVFGITAVAVSYIRRGIRWGWLGTGNGNGNGSGAHP